MKTEKVILSAGLLILRLAILILVIVGIWKVGELSYRYCYAIVSDLPAEESPGRDVAVTISSDMDAKKVSVLLERKGLVEDSQIFLIQVKVSGYGEKFHSGDYVLNTSMTPREMMEIMAGEPEEEEEE